MYVLLRNKGSSERGRCSRWKRSLIGGCGGAWAMERLTLSDNRGEYCATCFSVLHLLASSSLVAGHVCLYVLIGDTVERAVVVEAKVTGVDDVVCSGVRSELVQRLQVSYTRSVQLPTEVYMEKPLPRTSAMQSTRTLPCWSTRPWLGSSGTAPGTGPEGAPPLGR